MTLRLIAAATRVQFQISKGNIETLMPIFTSPLLALVSTAILVNSNRQDLVGWVLVAALLMTLGQMGILVGSEIIANERREQLLEVLVASPASYFVLLFTRIIILSSIGLLGFIEGWLIVRLVFNIHVAIVHPGLFVATSILTVFAAAATMLIAATLFCFSKTSRTYQNAISGPLYLIGGVLVPVAYLPQWLQPVSKGIYLYWAADLLRYSLQTSKPMQVIERMGAICLLGVIAVAIGATLLERMLNHLRREGTLGLS